MNLEKETICDFEVTERRKLVWKTCLDILCTFINICERNNFRYFAGGGTLLGCIRHKGFIPWDDDIDVYMMRSDYEKFIRIAQAELPSYYTLSNVRSHVQIKDGRTAALLDINYDFLSSNKNCGIFIDVFPLDYLSDNYKTRKRDARSIWFHGFCCGRKEKKSPLKSIKMKVYGFAAGLYNIFHSYQATAEKARNPFPNRKRTNTIGIATFAPGNENWAWSSDWFDESIRMPFEDLMICVPKGYDAALKKEFGDYMKIPENKKGSMHNCYYDPYKSYAEYVGISREDYAKLFENYSL